MYGVENKTERHFTYNISILAKTGLGVILCIIIMHDCVIGL